MIGKTVSHYKILEKLGEGGMGVVYKAEDTKLKRTVALKFLPPELMHDVEAKERFIHEAQAVSALDHSNICTIYEVGETPTEGREQSFIAMAYYDGETLRDRISRGPFKVEAAVDITIQVAEGLKEAHDKDIVHRDIKSANIMVTTKGQVKILDFGLARLTGRTKLTKTGTTLGTAAYMSPEQTRGEKVDGRSDIWSVGIVLYEMLTGQRPFKGEYEQAVVYSIMGEEPEPVTGLRTGVPMELERIVNKALKKNPAERYQNVEDLLVDLKGLNKALESEVKQQPAHVIEKTERKNFLKRASLPVGIGLILVLVFFLIRSFVSEDLLGSAPVPIAVISFENQTGDVSYDRLQKVIPNLLITSLEQSKYLRVTTWQRMNDLLKQAGMQDVQVIDEELGFKLCGMDGVDAIVLGSITKLCDIFVTDVKVLDVHTKEILKSVSSQGEGESSIIKKQIDELSQEIAKGIGLSGRKIETVQNQIVGVTTSSLEAYKHFLIGKEYYEKTYLEEAYQHLKMAIELDSTFAVAHLYLGYSYGRLGNTLISNTCFTRAKQYSTNATEKERLYILATYAINVDGNPDKRFKLLEEIAKKYPKEKRVYAYLGNYYDDKHLYDKAIEEFNKALKLDPNDRYTLNGLAHTYINLKDYENAVEYLNRYALLFPNDADPYDSMGDVYFKMGKLDRALENYEKAIGLRADFTFSYFGLAYVYALKEDLDEAIKWLDILIDRYPEFSPGSGGIWCRSSYYFLMGNLDEAAHSMDEARERIDAVENQTFSCGLDFTEAISFLDIGDLEKSEKFIQNWKDHTWNLDNRNQAYNAAYVTFLSGLLDIRKGRITSAEDRLADLRAIIPDLPMSVRGNIRYLTNLFYGNILLESGAIDEAIQICKKAVPAEIVDMGPSHFGYYGMPFVYASIKDVAARAYVKKGELDRAIVEYERLSTFDPTSKDRLCIHPKYHYRLAKLYEERGLTEKAIKEYKKFLEIWKEADEDLPEPHDARARLARLEQDF